MQEKLQAIQDFVDAKKAGLNEVASRRTELAAKISEAVEAVSAASRDGNVSEAVEQSRRKKQLEEELSLLESVAKTAAELTAGEKEKLAQLVQDAHDHANSLMVELRAQDEALRAEVFKAREHYLSAIRRLAQLHVHARYDVAVPHAELHVNYLDSRGPRRVLLDSVPLDQFIIDGNDLETAFGGANPSWIGLHTLRFITD